MLRGISQQSKVDGAMHMEKSYNCNKYSRTDLMKRHEISPDLQDILNLAIPKITLGLEQS